MNDSTTTANRDEPRNREVWRVLDANANRAAEGLRTLEDYARLVTEDTATARRVKQLRHLLAEVLAPLPRSELLLARATHADAGIRLSTHQEEQRGELAQVVPAACQRVSQSLRVLEEFSKYHSAALGQAFKQLRYETYDVLAETELRLVTGRQLTPDQRLYLLVDCSQAIEHFQQQLRQLAAAGVDLFQLRDKAADGGQLMRYARAGVAALSETAARLIVNDRLDIALAAGAAGVHLGQDDLGLSDARRLAAGRLWIGISTHDLDQAVAAQDGGADYIGCGPTFPSQTKQFTSFAGTHFLQQAAAAIEIPLFAIGGITLDNIDQVLQAGCGRAAVTAAITRAADPQAAARQLKYRLCQAPAAAPVS